MVQPNTDFKGITMNTMILRDFYKKLARFRLFFTATFLQPYSSYVHVLHSITTNIS